MECLSLILTPSQSGAQGTDLLGHDLRLLRALSRLLVGLSHSSHKVLHRLAKHSGRKRRKSLLDTVLAADWPRVGAPGPTSTPLPPPRQLALTLLMRSPPSAGQKSGFWKDGPRPNLHRREFAAPTITPKQGGIIVESSASELLTHCAR